MNCDDARKHWELYHDSEGDSELYLSVNEHLAACPACSQWFRRHAAFEEALTAKLAAAAPTPDLWRRVLADVGVVQPVAPRGWSFLGPFFAIAAALLIAFGLWQYGGTAESDHLSALTAAVHRELSSGAAPIGFTSDSDVAVESYLKQRVAFPVRCPPRKDAGFIVRGGGVCEIAGDSAAYVCGQVGDGEVSVFILPEERLAQFVHERDALAKETIHHCREGDFDMVLAKIDRNIVVVIGHGSPAQLEKVVRAYGTYPEGPDANDWRSPRKPRQPLPV